MNAARNRLAIPSLSPKETFDLFNPEINWNRVYSAYFQNIPSSKSVDDINAQKVRIWIETSLESRIFQVHLNERCKFRKVDFVEAAYVLRDGIIIFVSHRTRYVDILYSGCPDTAQLLANDIVKFKRRSRRTQIYLVVQDLGISLTALRFKKLKVCLEENYNDDLVALHPRVVQLLNKKQVSGLFLFHGIPGTGKSTYIRSLIGCTIKKIIFLPPNLAACMDSPEIAGLLIANPNSVIVIEDAEDLLVSRDKSSNSAISMLLNLTDGLLGACLGIQFVCTFNTHVSNIDRALLRKGRLMGLYEFKPLTVEKSRLLLSKRSDRGHVASGPMTLAEIYNIDGPDLEYATTQNPMGFAVNI